MKKKCLRRKNKIIVIKHIYMIKNIQSGTDAFFSHYIIFTDFQKKSSKQNVECHIIFKLLQNIN